MGLKDMSLGKKNSVKTPSKRYMNFVNHENPVNLKVIIPAAVVTTVALACFIKFGIWDLVAEENRANAQLTKQQEQLNMLQSELTDYESVSKEYGRYSYEWMTDIEVGTVGRMEVLALVESKIGPHAIIENMAVNDNALTLNIHGLTLEQASRVVMDLETSELVESASLNNATASDGEEANIFMSIMLTKEVEDHE